MWHDIELFNPVGVADALSVYIINLAPIWDEGNPSIEIGSGNLYVTLKGSKVYNPNNRNALRPQRGRRKRKPDPIPSQINDWDNSMDPG